MNTPKSSTSLATLLVTMFSIAALCSAHAWKIEIDPPGSVSFSYTIPQTGETATLTTTTIIGLTKGQTLNFTATAEPGYDLVSIKHKAFNVMPPGSASPYVGSIPVAPEDRGTLKVQLKEQNPIGEVTIRPFGPTTNIRTVVNATGTYTFIVDCRSGVMSQSFDPAGKGDVMGTVEGVAGPGGVPTMEAVASIKTKAGESVVSYKGSAKTGSIDGIPASGSGKAETSLNLEELAGQKVSEGVASGNAIEAGEKISYKKALVETPISDENAEKLKSDWDADIDITEETDAKGKKKVFAAATLTKPGGDKVYFPKKAIRYGKTGYNLAFSNGNPLDSEGNPLLDLKGNPVKEKSTKLAIKGMSMALVGDNWEPTGQGEISFQMLGQKASKAPLSEFVQ